MTITTVTTTRIHAPLARPFVTAVRRTDCVESVIVHVLDADGRCGWGEASHNPRVTGETAAGIEAVIDSAIAPAVVGREALELVEISTAVSGSAHGNRAAKAAVDAAVHDLAAQSLGVPLRVLLGGRRSRLRTDVTISVGTRDELAEQAAERSRAGFDVLKVKLDGRDDVGRVRAVADAAGAGVRLRLDANQAWTAKQAVRVVRELEDAGVPLDLVEQPVAAGDLDGLAHVTANVATPVLADESVHTAADVLEIARRRAADTVNLKLAKCGGVGPAREFVAAARTCGLGVIVGSMMETHVAAGPAAEVAAALTDADHAVDLDPPFLLRRPPVTGGLRFDGPIITLPEAPGLGITGFAHDSDTTDHPFEFTSEGSPRS